MKYGMFQLAFVLVIMAAVADAQTCNSTLCDRNTNCVGFANQICNNASTFYTGSLCLSASHCASYAQANGDFSVQLSGQPPNVINNYYSIIRQAIVSAYNDYCRTNNNYQICCPGSSDWPNKATQLNRTAMASEAEVLILSAYGDSGKTVLALRLAPLENSSLCTSVTYTTTTSTTSTTTSTTRTTVSAASNSNTVATTAAPAAASSTMASSAAAAAAASTTMATSMAAAASTATTAAANNTMAGASTTTMAAGSSATMTGASTATMAAGSSATMTGASTATMAAATTTMAAATTTMAAATTTMAAATTTMAAASNSSNSTAAPSGRRRKREVDFDSLMAEEKADDSELVLHRSRRAALTLSVSAISAISSSIQISQIIQTALSNNNLTVTVTVTAVGVPLQSLGSQLDSSRLFASCAAALVMTIFSLRR